MKTRVTFGVALFLAGAAFHVLFGYLWGLSAPSPQWLLLTVLAVGALGRVNTAQSLGFFWGLFLDVQGSSLFGAQGWILAAAGFATGRLSRHVDADKPLAQAVLAVGGTFFHLVFLALIEAVFRQGGRSHVPGPGAMLVQLLMNVAAAPLVFAAVAAWARRAAFGGEDHVFRS